MNLLATITTLAKRNGLRFLVAGGHAVIAHGFPRNTFDLDIVVVKADAPVWRERLLELGYTILREGPTFLQFNPSHADELPLDLMLVNAPVFEKFLAEAVPSSPICPEVSVVSLKHLLALKAHALRHAHPGRIIKDADDVIQLVEINRIDVTASEWRELFLKHGPPDFYEKLVELQKGR